MTALSQFSLEGRRALITGASRGIGRTLAEGLGAAGARVALGARSGDELKAVAEGIREAGGTAATVLLDVSDAASCGRAVRAAAEALGGLDVLVNNAGMEQVCPSLDVDEGLWDRILDTNLKGAFFCAQAAARIMRDAGGGGAVVNVCSLTSEVGIPTAVPYGSSKSGLLGMTRALAVEWAPLGIRVNGIAPGYFRTDLTEVFYRDAAWQQAMLAKIPAGRFGQLDDLVGATVFLCSPAAAYVTGQCLFIDGGFMASI
ncbi:MAG: SDR family NAD(P)-dependent oxidoreductase [Betaproteobacteria bacterium]|nr:glucose 1-dehydrogenase [Rhodocyclaceae bacterium]MCA3134937.1 glucose 1-dehydrogenase [Rhodocyclaceae bacterium]MCA3141317.1 glucose 1-dehydrogenase [Rhodocyclaceae bacterium]MCA3147404.1 glucose 1-dehydrogenase [Rhodocyclaceae bacterium]MCE2899457.1 glucose 1-dehydrogenase [Betaproteobacteria bacterium]